MKDITCAMIGIIGRLVTSLLGGWTTAMTTLLIFMSIDCISGIIVPTVFKKSTKTQSGTLESRTGRKGLCRKGIFLKSK